MYFSFYRYLACAVARSPCPATMQQAQGLKKQKDSAMQEPAETQNPAELLRGEEVEFLAIRAQGAGGQNVNKVSNAVHLRFNIADSSLPEIIKERLLRLADQRVSTDGVIVIKAQEYRSLVRNRENALERLREMIAAAAFMPRPRRATKPSRAAQQRRLEGKTQRAQIKAQRGKISD